MPGGRTRRRRGETTAEIGELEQALIVRGVTPIVAAGLAGSHPEEHIRERIEIFDWLSGKKDRRVSKNPGGYLADSIRKGYVPPRGFESKTARDKKQADELERKRKAEEARRRTEAEEAARKRISFACVILDSLSPSRGERHSRPRAPAKADPIFVRQYRRSKGNAESEARYLKLIVAMHVGGLLAERESAH